MGVKHLWDIIDETKSKETLDYLRGKVVTVDLSIWIVEAIKTLQFKTSILKPHLRNIFYRILALRKMGIKLLFVTEGAAPELKQNTMKKRNELQYGVKSKTKSRVGRSRFQSTIKECCCLLDLLGMPYIKAAGEAEAMCAVLNLRGFSDGSLTNDGDTFLYGGQTVFQDFGIDPKDPHVFVYNIETIKKRLNINRNDMIGLALLAGCDYTNGVAGVGKGLITNFLKERSFTEDLLSRFTKWMNKDSNMTEFPKSEVMIARKAIKSDNFYNQQIIDEYLISRDVLNNANEKLQWGYPDIRGLQEFLDEKMEWPFEYTLSKIMQLASSTYLEKMADNIFYPVPISPVCVAKTRCQHGVSLVEINWEKDPSLVYNVDMRWDNCPDTFTTLENHQVVLKLLPGLVESYLQMKESKKSDKAKKKVRKNKKQVKESNPELNENDSSKDHLANKCHMESKNNDYCSDFPRESQESQAYQEVLESQEIGFSKSSGDFLTDVLCDDMKEISLHDVVSDEVCISHDGDESDKENVLPLMQRLQQKGTGSAVVKKKTIQYNSANRNEDDSIVNSMEAHVKEKSVCLHAPYEQSFMNTWNSIKTMDLPSHVVPDELSSLVLQDEHDDFSGGIDTSGSRQKKCLGELELNSINASNLSSPSLKNNSLIDINDVIYTPVKNAQSTTKGSKISSNRTGGQFVENTPFCFQFDTPILQANTPNSITSILQENTPKSIHTKQHTMWSSSTPFMKETPCQHLVIMSPLLQDITSFSNLGDSILGHSMDLFGGCEEVEQYNECTREYVESLEQNLSRRGESMLYNSLDLCEPSVLISKVSGFGDSILCESLDLANADNTSHKYLKNRGSHDYTRTPDTSRNYEDLLREKFQISLICDDVSMGSAPNFSVNSPNVSNDISMVETSPLSLADRLKKAFVR